MRDLLQRVCFLAQVRGPGHHGQALRAAYVRVGLLVESDHLVVGTADDEQFRRCRGGQRYRPGQVWPASSGDHGSDFVAQPSGRRPRPCNIMR